MLGFPGSGKSYVSQWLAPLLGAVHLRTDDLRIQMFGEDKLEYHRSWKYQKQVHGAAHYIFEQILIAGHSVIYDANHNAARSRQEIAELAQKHDSIAIVVWVKTPLAMAEQRVLDREAAGGHKAFETDFVERMARRLESPTGQELVIVLKGTDDAAEQQRSFGAQLAKLLEEQVQ